MKKIYGYLPISARAKHSITPPDNWDEMSKEDQDEYFYDHSERESGLCHQCAGCIDTDFDVDFYAMEECEIEWWEA